MRFTDSSDLEQERKRERRGHIDSEEREQILRMQKARAAGNHSHAEEILDKLVKRYWHAVEETADVLEKRGEVRDDVLSAGATKLVYALGHFEAAKGMRLDGYIKFCLNPAMVVGRVPKKGVARRDQRQHITNMPDDFWKNIPDPRSEGSAEISEEIADTLWELVYSLDKRLITVIENRYFEIPQKTASQIAPLIGVTTRERVMQLEAIAIESLRIQAEASGLRDLMGLTAEKLQELLRTLKGKPTGGGLNMPAGRPGSRGPRPKKP